MSTRVRYGIAEWYGRSFPALTPEKRQTLAISALGEAEPPLCPFRPMFCTKKGGVCSIQPYRETEEGRLGRSEGPPAIVCPSRFEENDLVVRWLAEIVGFHPHDAMIAREIPFMKSATTGKAAGKIDLVIATDPGRNRFRWFGLEIQAVYFSGKGMSAEFAKLRDDPHPVPPFPLETRRPDWRSSSAKRLMPQLQVKGPTLRRWHSKIAVAIDAPFFADIGGPSLQPSHDLDTGDVVWLIPELRDGSLVRGHWEVLTLEDSSRKLLNANPMSRKAFENVLRSKLTPLHTDTTP